MILALVYLTAFDIQSDPFDCCRGDAFYPDANTLGVVDHKDSEEGINRMVDDLEKQ